MIFSSAGYARTFSCHYMLGIFDSGLGGLTVYKAIKEKLPQFRILYYGDNARVPYGNRSAAVVYEFTKEAVNFLFRQGCQLIILACNTATAVALRRIQQEYLPQHYPDRRVLGVIRPVVEFVAVQSTRKKIGVIGTQATIASEAYIHELHKIDPNIEIFQQATPLLVPLIEDGRLHNHRVTTMILREYLRPLKKERIDTLILGCTHYPFLLREIQSIMGKQCQVLPAHTIVAESLENYLQRHADVALTLEKNAPDRFCLTDKNQRFEEITKKWLNGRVEFEILKTEICL